MKKCLIFLFVLFVFQIDSSAQKNDEIYTIYLVRHSEKDLDSNNYSNPSLTECGVMRSINLSNFLRDVNIDMIYSTDYIRTKSTAEPTAIAKELKVNIYEDSELEKLSNILIECKKDVLVVGHSYTTPILAGLLIGEELDEISLDIYNRIYKVVFYKNEGELHLLHTTFECIY